MHERNQTQKATYLMTPFVCNVRIGKSIGTESKLAVTRSCGRENGEWLQWVCGDENIPEMR